MYKPLQAAGMSADNVRIWVIVRKMNIWPEKRSLQGERNFEDNFSAKNMKNRKPEGGLFLS